MVTCHFEPFIGLRLLVCENDLRDRGQIIDCTCEPNGTMKFTTTTGEYSFFYLKPKEMIHLTNGDWRLPGNTPRWAYVCQADSLYIRQLGGLK